MTTETVCVPRDLLLELRDTAYAEAQQYHLAMKNYRNHEHDRLDKIVVDVDALLAQPVAREPVAADCNGSGCESCRYECHEDRSVDHIPAVGNMVKGPIGQIERWFCEGRDSVGAAQCRYGEHTLARHWWSRGFSYTQRKLDSVHYKNTIESFRSIIESAQFNCDPDDFAIDWLNECLLQFDMLLITKRSTDE